MKASPTQSFYIFIVMLFNFYFLDAISQIFEFQLHILEDIGGDLWDKNIFLLR
jgi:hypothetical protein